MRYWAGAIASETGYMTRWKNAGSKNRDMALGHTLTPNLGPTSPILVPKMRRFSAEDVQVPRTRGAEWMVVEEAFPWTDDDS